MDSRKPNKRMDTSKVILFLFSMLFMSCHDQQCEDLILKLETYKQIDHEFKVDLQDIFTNPWEELYIFQGFNTPEDISDVIGFKYKGDVIYDPSRLILQISNEVILSESRTECLSINLDRVMKNGCYMKEKKNSIVTIIVSQENEKTYSIKN